LRTFEPTVVSANAPVILAAFQGIVAWRVRVYFVADVSFLGFEQFLKKLNIEEERHLPDVNALCFWNKKVITEFQNIFA
jgi:hypothetical protein